MRRRFLPLVVTMLVVAGASVSAAAEPSGVLVGRAADASGNPLADVCVSVFGAAGGTSAPAMLDTATGLDGRYRLVGVVPGTYDVRFTDCDPVPTFVETTRTGVAVTGTATSTADAVLPAGGFITGRVTGPADAPAGGLCIQAADPAVQQRAPETTTTARDGTYRVGPLPAGNNVVVLFADCRPTPSLVAQLLGGGLDLATARRVAVAPGVTVAGQDATLPLGATISGTVDDGAGAPHRGACLTAEPPGATGLFVGAAAESEPNGSFVLGGLSPGRYHVGAGLCPAANGTGVDVTVGAGQAVTGVKLVLPASHVARLAGPSPADTAVAVARSQPSTTVLLARDDSPVEALAATPLAASLDAPLLLTPANRLAAPVVAYLKEQRVTDAVLLGSLGPGVEAAVRAAGVKATRVGGPDRFATAAQIAGMLDAQSAYVVADGDWAGAVAISTLAALEGRPILLTAPHRLTDATAEVVGGMTSVDVVGGRGSVGDEVVDALARTVPHVGRITGADPADTSARAVRLGAVEGLAYRSVWVTGGRSWSDGLVAAVAAARGAGPLLVLGPGNRQLLRANAGAVANLRVVGDPTAVPAATYAELAALPPSSCARTERC